MADPTKQPALESKPDSAFDIAHQLSTTIDSLLSIWQEGGPNQDEEPRLRKNLEALLQKPEATIDFLNPQIESLILLSAQEEEDTLFKLLICHDPDAGLNPDFPAPSNEVLFWAATHGYAGLVKRLLDVDGIDPNVMDDYEGETPLTCAASNDWVDVLRVLLNDERVEIDLCPGWGQGKDGQGSTHTALWWAVWSRKERAARHLRERGAAFPRIKGENLVRSLCIDAIEKEMVTILEIVLGTCRNEYATGQGPRGFFRWQFFSNHHRRTLISLAAETGNVHVLELLERHSDNFSGGMNLLDSHGRTAIWYAASNGHDAALRVLLPLVDHPRAIEFADDQGKTPLVEAAEQWTSRREYPASQRSRALARRADVIRQLLLHPMVKTELLSDEDLWLLLGRSVRGRHVEIVGGLVRKDSRVNHQSTCFDGSNKMTLISWAENSRHKDLVAQLLEKMRCTDEASSESDNTVC